MRWPNLILTWPPHSEWSHLILASNRPTRRVWRAWDDDAQTASGERHLSGASHISVSPGGARRIECRGLRRAVYGRVLRDGCV